ncbi:hypothetical protein ACHAXS_004673 [Conticribra weissflogii]
MEMRLLNYKVYSFGTTNTTTTTATTTFRSFTIKQPPQNIDNINNNIINCKNAISSNYPSMYIGPYIILALVSILYATNSSP